MPIDTAAKRRSAAGLPFLPLGPNVAPDAARPAAWRQQAGWGYSGVPAGPPGASGPSGGAWVVHDPGRRWAVLDPGRRWVMASNPAELRKKTTASRVYSADFTQHGELRAGETLVPTPTVVPAPPGLTVSGVAVVGNRVQFRLSGGAADVTYTLAVTAPTSGGNTLADDVTLRVY